MWNDQDDDEIITFESEKDKHLIDSDENLDDYLDRKSGNSKPANPYENIVAKSYDEVNDRNETKQEWNEHMEKGGYEHKGNGLFGPKEEKNENAPPLVNDDEFDKDSEEEQDEDESPVNLEESSSDEDTSMGNQGVWFDLPMANLKEPLKIKVPFIWLNLGEPGSGKSHFTKYLTWASVIKNRIFNLVLYATTTAEDNPKQLDWMDPNWIFTEFHWGIMEKLIGYSRQYRFNETGFQALVIIDDPVGAINFNDPKWFNYVTTFRHKNISMVINAQYLNRVFDPIWKNSIRTGCFWQLTNKNSFNAAYDCFGQAFRTDKDFKYFCQHRAKLSVRDHNFVCFNKNAEDESKIYALCVCPKKIPRFKILNEPTENYKQVYRQPQPTQPKKRKNAKKEGQVNKRQKRSGVQHNTRRK